MRVLALLRPTLSALWLTVASASGLFAQVTSPAAAPLRYRIVPAGSILRWELPATLHTVHGRVGSFHGVIEAAPAVEGGWTVKARIVADADSMTTGNVRRDRVMKEKVLETSRYPEIVFEATSVKADLSKFAPGASLTAEVTGDLTVRGKALPVQLPVSVYVFQDHVVLAGSFPLHWKQYGLPDPSFGIVRVKEPMQVAFRLRAVPNGDGPAARLQRAPRR